MWLVRHPSSRFERGAHSVGERVSVPCPRRECASRQHQHGPEMSAEENAQKVKNAECRGGHLRSADDRTLILTEELACVCLWTLLAYICCMRRIMIGAPAIIVHACHIHHTHMSRARRRHACMCRVPCAVCCVLCAVCCVLCAVWVCAVCGRCVAIGHGHGGPGVRCACASFVLVLCVARLLYTCCVRCVMCSRVRAHSTQHRPPATGA
jgi:hypothetical protein